MNSVSSVIVEFNNLQFIKALVLLRNSLEEVRNGRLFFISLNHWFENYPPILIGGSWAEANRWVAKKRCNAMFYVLFDLVEVLEENLSTKLPL